MGHPLFELETLLTALIAVMLSCIFFVGVHISISVLTYADNLLSLYLLLPAAISIQMASLLPLLLYQLNAVIHPSTPPPDPSPE